MMPPQQTATGVPARLGPIELAPGVSRRNALCFMWAAFVSIGVFTYITTLQPYLLAVNLDIPPDQRGKVSGDLQFWQEVIVLACVGVIGAWSDRVGRRTVYIFGFLVMAVAYAAYPFAGDIGQLTILRLIFAVGIAALAGMLATVLADYSADRDRGKFTGLSFVLNAIGALIFFVGLSRLPELYVNMGLDELAAGRGAYLTATGICLVSAAVMIGLKPGPPTQRTEHVPMLQLIREGVYAGKQPRIALAYVCAFTARADLVIVALFLALWVTNAALETGHTAAEATAKIGVLFGVVQGCAMLWAPVFGWVADRFDRVTVVIIAVVLSIVGYGWIGYTPDPISPAAFLAAAALGIGQTSGILASQVLIAQEAPVKIRGSVIGMVGFCGALGILVISKVGGIAFDEWRPGAPFIIMAAANIGLLVLAVWVRLTTRSEPREALATA